MGKKTKYGDPRKLDLDTFTVDFLEPEFLANYWAERAKMKELYDSAEVRVPKIGQTANVTYIGISQNYFIFDGGFKDYVRIENRINESKYLKNTNVGDLVDVLIVNIDERDYTIQGSIAEIYESNARTTLTNLDEGVSVLCTIREMAPAGFNVDIFFEGVTLPGFMPNTLAGINKIAVPEKLLGQTMEVMIESYSRDEGTYIVSRRRYLQTLIPQAINELEFGVVYTGIVTGTTPFGVFVEFKDCLTGMIHKTNMQEELAERISEIPSGVEIEFFIKEIVKEKIILTQILRETLWDTIKVGQIIQGKVRDVKNFGILVSLDPETVGLIHNSEVEKSSISRTNPGDPLKVRILAVDRSARKIFLSYVQ